MAAAVATPTPGSMETGPTGFRMTYQVIYSGTDVPNGSDMSEVTIDFAHTDTVVEMGNKIGAGVRTEGNRLGYSVGTNNVITHGFTKV